MLLPFGLVKRELHKLDLDAEGEINGIKVRRTGWEWWKVDTYPIDLCEHDAAWEICAQSEKADVK